VVLIYQKQVMILLIILGSVYLFLSLIAHYVKQIRISKVDKGCIALSAMFLFTGAFHFLIEKKLISLIPEFIPLRLEIVYFSGIAELIFAGGFLFPKTRALIGKISILFLISVFPGNVYGAIQHVDLAGHVYGPVYLLFRLPLQVFLIYWIFYFSLRRISN